MSGADGVSDQEARDIEGPVRILLCAVLFTASVAFAREALTFHPLAMYAPLAAGVLASVLMGALLCREILRAVRKSRGDDRTYGKSMEALDDAVTVQVVKSSARYVLILAGYVVAIYAVGLVIASVAVLAYLLRFDARASMKFTAISLASLLVAFYVFGTYMELQWPNGLLGIDLLGLPL